MSLRSARNCCQTYSIDCCCPVRCVWLRWFLQFAPRLRKAADAQRDDRSDDSQEEKRDEDGDEFMHRMEALSKAQRTELEYRYYRNLSFKYDTMNIDTKYMAEEGRGQAAYS